MNIDNLIMIRTHVKFTVKPAMFNVLILTYILTGVILSSTGKCNYYVYYNKLSSSTTLNKIT